jgi:hypothetical protein
MKGFAMNRTGRYITDDQGRTLILRGVNLGGSSKIPFGAKGGSGPESLKNPEAVSFIGRPFPLEEAEEHFEKLKNWGFTFVRLVITWEALEHAGPGIYDESYLAYLRKILLIAGEKGISVFMDPHQDAWSRFTGGDGAPGWTLEKLGMDTGKLAAAGAALSLGHGNREGKASRRMIWPVNYSLYAAATMFTLFFGGNVFAPQVTIEGESAQDWLQERYMAAFRHCYRRLKNCGAVAGWGVMNEPHPGFIGYRDIRGLENAALAAGPVPCPFHAMIAASGRPVEVPAYGPWLKGWRITGRETINARGVSLFKEGFACPWKQAGVWAGEAGEARLLKPHHFSAYRGRPARFADDFIKPFAIRFIERMKEAERRVLFFIEGVPHGESPSWGKEDPQNTVNAFHHYDGLTLFTKSFRPWLALDWKTGKIILGRKKAQAHYSAKLAEAKAWARERMGDMPCLLAEFGLPFDLNNGRAYKTGDYSLHEKALSLYYGAIDENLLGSTIWNYTADNTREEGDRWNGEDLSIVSGGEGRAVGGWLRPYPMATAGVPLKFFWDRKTASFHFRYRTDPGIEAPTEIFLPSRWFGKSPSISAHKIAGHCLKTTGHCLQTTDHCLQTTDHCLQTAGHCLQTAGHCLKTTGHCLQTAGHCLQTAGHCLQTMGGGSLRYEREGQRLSVYNDGYAGEAEVRVSGGE